MIVTRAWGLRWSTLYMSSFPALAAAVSVNSPFAPAAGLANMVGAVSANRRSTPFDSAYHGVAC